MAELQIEIVPVLSDNYVYLAHEPESGHTSVVDPAVAAPVRQRLDEKGWSLDSILVTHHHPDHTGGVVELKEAFDVEVTGPEAERETIPGIDHTVEEGDEVAIGNARGVVFETPGHTLGHVSYWFEEAEVLFCADVLFALGCGRVFEGTPAQMWESLNKLRQLPDSTRVYCGHEYTQSNARFALTVDPNNRKLQERASEIDRLREAGEPTVPSTLGLEKRTNPFLRPDDADIRQLLKMASASDAEVFAEIRARKDRG